MTIKQLMAKLKILRSKGFVRSARGHDTGIGHTLERALGLKENNLSIPDLGRLELKAQRKETSSLITLFTKKPDDELNSSLLDKFGYISPKSGLKVIHQTITARRPNKQGFQLFVTKDQLVIKKNGKRVFSYDKGKLEQVFYNKFGKGAIVVLAESQKSEDNPEKFHYQEAYLIKRGDFEKFLQKLFYDIRIGRYPNGKPHDHGSGFRIRAGDLKNIFAVYRKLI